MKKESHKTDEKTSNIGKIKGLLAVKFGIFSQLVLPSSATVDMKNQMY